MEIRHLQRTEVQEAEEPFTQGQKGSSAMPHKRNPILSENVSGLARLMDDAINKLDTYDWIIFTSVNGVDFFSSRLKRLERALPGEIRSAAIGPETAKARWQLLDKFIEANGHLLVTNGYVHMIFIIVHSGNRI